MKMSSRGWEVVLLIGVVLAGEGCAGIAIPPFSPGAGTAGTQEVQYTMAGVADRSFSVPVEQVRKATLTTFKRMHIALKTDQMKDDGHRELVAFVGDRTVYVDLERLTARTTRMRITAKHGWFWRDRATAGEIIVQTERTLDDTAAVTRRGK
jgi:hypothetical protein